MRSKSIQMSPSERFILNASSADTKDQLWGSPCFTQIEKETPAITGVSLFQMPEQSVSN